MLPRLASDLCLVIYSGDDAVYTLNAERHIRYLEILASFHEPGPVELKGEEVLEGVKSKKISVYKIMIMAEREDVPELEVRIRNAHGYPSVHFLQTQPEMLEAMHLETNKARAVDWVMRQLGISKECVLAFGDGLNDLEMMQSVGLSVCMGNGEAELRKVCKYVTDSNNECGVASFLEQVFNL